MTTDRPIAIIASRIFAPEPAAASYRLMGLARGLLGQDAEVRVLTSTYPGLVPDDPDDLQVSRWPVLRDKDNYLRGYVPYLSFDVPLFVRLLGQRRVDVVVCEPPPTTGLVVRVVSALRRVPYVYYAADIWSDAAESTGAPGIVVKLLRAAERWVMRGAAGTIAVSNAVGQRLAAMEIPRVTVVRNGVDTDVFRPDGPLPQPLPQRPYLLYAGTTSEWQGAEVFVRAMHQVIEEIPDAQLVFLGQGSAWSDLLELSRDLPPGVVSMRPIVPPEEAARWQRGAAAAVVSTRPGIGYDLAYPTKIYAALASGTPVVYAGPGPAVDDIRQEHLGWAVEHDPEAVAVAMVAALRAARDEPERQRLSSWVRDHASVAAAGRSGADVVLAARQR